MNRLFLFGIAAATFLILVLAVLASSQGPAPDRQQDLITATGLHWHVRLGLTVKGRDVPLPHDVGRSGGREQPIHTHAEDDLIHLEFPGPVHQSDVTLGRFFKTWGQTLTHTCLLQYCNGPEGNLSMTVNGRPNPDFENYGLRDGDAIIIKYE